MTMHEVSSGQQDSRGLDGPMLLILCHHPEDKAGPLMVTFRTAFLNGAQSCAASGRKDIAYVWLRGPHALRRVLAMMRAKRPLIVLFNGLHSLLLPVSLVILALNAWRYRTRQVMLWYEDAVDTRKAAGIAGDTWRLRLWRRCVFPLAQYLLVNERTRYLTTSRLNKHLIMFLQGVEPSYIRVAECAVDVKDYPVRDRRVPAAEIRIAMAGTLSYRKGFDLFLELAMRFKTWAGRPIRYTWYSGSPQELAHARATRARALDLSGVELAGRVPDLPAALARQDVYVQSSRAEGFGIAALEALACDLPVFCFDSTATADFAPPSLVCTNIDEMIEKIRAYLDDPLRWEPGCFRRIALAFNRDRFLKGWRGLERDLRFEPGLPV